MKKALMAVFLSVMALGLTMGDAEARRLGGGKTLGMQRQAVQPAPAKQVTPASPTSPAAAPAAAPKRNWLGPIAGLAAGLGLAALFSHLGMGEGLANAVMIGLLLMAALFVFRMLFRRNTPAASPKNQAMQYAGAGHASAAPSPVEHGGGAFAGGVQPASRIPADFDAEGFVRVAKLNFVRLQAANDAKNVEDIREFTSPELFAEIRLQMDERGDVQQQTDVVRLDAELLEVVTEGNLHIASVRFSGLIREEADSAAVPFEEVWNLSKPVAGDKGWIIAGLQQVN